MLAENQKELQHEKDIQQIRALMELHLQLKKFEMEITKELGTVIMH
jgi:hypothetical protein